MGSDQDYVVEVRSCVIPLNKILPCSTKLTKSVSFILRPDALSYQSLMTVLVLHPRRRDGKKK